MAAEGNEEEKARRPGGGQADLGGWLAIPDDRVHLPAHHPDIGAGLGRQGRDFGGDDGPCDVDQGALGGHGRGRQKRDVARLDDRPAALDGAVADIAVGVQGPHEAATVEDRVPHGARAKGRDDGVHLRGREALDVPDALGRLPRARGAVVPSENSHIFQALHQYPVTGGGAHRRAHQHGHVLQGQARLGRKLMGHRLAVGGIDAVAEERPLGLRAQIPRKHRRRADGL